MCPGHETDGEFAGESGNLHRKWWQTENLRFSLILQIVENQRSKQRNKKAERGVRPAKRQKMVEHIYANRNSFYVFISF